jgi:hypothetical protein
VDATWLADRGNKALALVERHREAVEPRLPAGLLAGLEEDLGSLTERRAAAKQARSRSKLATVTQNQLLTEIVDIISAVQGAARRRNDLKAAQKRGYGVGVDYSRRSVASVSAVGATILDRAAKDPDEARDLGLFDDQVAALRDLLSKLNVQDKAQQKLIAEKPLTTAARNRATWRVYAAIQRVAGAGVIAFAQNASLRAPFDALDDLPKRKKKRG